MYESFYSFTGKPFRLTPDPAMLFPSKGHQRAMSYLLYGFDQGEGFVMITGAVGTGKTLLIQTLLQELAARDIEIASIASANLDDDEILPAIAASFGLPYEGCSKEMLLQDLKRYLADLSAQGRHALLVVDEAQTLTPAALEMLRILSNLEHEGRALMQVFLVGQSDLRRTIVENHMEQLRQRIVASYRLEPMDAEETKAYILHRLHAVGWRDDPELAPGVFVRVHGATQGIPRKINLVMDRLLLYGYLEERHSLGVAAVSTVVGEMRDELPGVPQSLEPTGMPAVRTAPRPSRTNARAQELAALEQVRNRIMLQLVREEVRLKRSMGADPTRDDAAGVAQLQAGQREE